MINVLTFLFLSLSASAYFSNVQKFDGEKEMNGISFEKNKEHYKKWNLVTVRYRTDAKELRITYANDLAWKHLLSGKLVPYPEGSMFSKISYKTEQDPAFLSSEVPGQSRRYQFMLKNSKKYKGTDGWGYALFDENGVTFDEDPVVKTQSCHACHQVVKGKDFVFSEPIPFAAGQFAFRPRPIEVSITWEDVELKKFDISLMKDSPNDKSVLRIRGPFERAVFSGTFDEILPNLIAKTREQKKTTLFYSDSKNFSLAFLGQKKDCIGFRIIFKGETVKSNEECLSK